jgi:hypothetical protein
MPNRLASESSLYLRQHANNPVDWFPWGSEAIARAKELNRPIFLSVGYSACHWCHVMEHECFENEAIATILNDRFVSIKVDREERPDVDQIYMTAHHLLNRGEGGGWPLSVFLTPDLTPFYAGTYFPPVDKYGRPGFPRVLLAIDDAWANKRDQLMDLGSQVAEHLNRMGHQPMEDDSPLSLDLLTAAGQVLKRVFDSTNGGFGHAPKFPHPLEVKLLLRMATREGIDPSFPHREEGREGVGLLHMARHTLEKMARGGMYDQIGGGFHRYSVDAVWLVPHFEKMLYDNALLPPVYADAYRLTGEGFYQQIACETLDWVLKEMTHPSGGFFSTLDADSEGEEGKFYVWSETELDEILGTDLSRLAKAVYGTSVRGNFEGHNILFRSWSDEEDAKALRMSGEEFRTKLAEIKSKLYAVRAKRVWPGRDEKVLTAWNGLMIAAFSHCGAAFDEPKYTAAAVKAAEFLLANLRDANGRLWRTWGEGVGAKLTAYLEDYANLTDALITLYEATFEPRWIATACELADAMIRHFADPSGGFFFTADDHEKLIARTKDLQDGSVPSGNAMAATALLRLAKLTGRNDYFERAVGTLKTYRGMLSESPMAVGQMLVALDFYLGPVDEVAVLGGADAETREMIRHLHSRFRPHRVIAFHDPTTGDPNIELLKNKPMIDHRPTVYVCRDFACQTPLVGIEAVTRLCSG